MIQRGILAVMIAIQLATVARAQPLHPPFQPPITARKIRLAIDDAVLHLRSQQQENGSIVDYDAQPGGGTSLAALAMLAAGVDPVSDKQLQKALEFLAQLEPNNTYIRGLRANVWEYALRRAPNEKKYRQPSRSPRACISQSKSCLSKSRYFFSLGALRRAYSHTLARRPLM
jgi:hypothetical protein